MKLSRAAGGQEAGVCHLVVDEGDDGPWQKKRERFLLGDWWTPAFLNHREKGGKKLFIRQLVSKSGGRKRSGRRAGQRALGRGLVGRLQSAW
jgi:hypothetical protein